MNIPAELGERLAAFAAHDIARMEHRAPGSTRALVAYIGHLEAQIHRLQAIHHRPRVTQG